MKRNRINTPRKMQHVYLFLCFVLALSRISSAAERLQCPSCTYLTSDADIHAAVKFVIDGILNLFQDPECAQELKDVSTKIKEETCKVIKGEVSKCSFYKGSMTLTIPLVFTEVNVPLQMYQRGCYHSKRANVPEDGCHKRENINEDKTIIKQILDKASSTFEKYDVAEFTGEMCLCTNAYCKDDISGVSQGARLNALLLLLCVLIYVALH